MPILTEIVFGKFDDYRLYDSSTIQNDRYVYYFKRLFKDNTGFDQGKADKRSGDFSNNTKVGGDDRSTLQLFVFDLMTKEENMMPKCYSLNEQVVE